jgi:hypothetical protein
MLEPFQERLPIGSEGDVPGLGGTTRSTAMGANRRDAIRMAGAVTVGAALSSPAPAAEIKGPQVVMAGVVDAEGKVLVGTGFKVKKAKASNNGDAVFDVVFDKPFVGPVVVTASPYLAPWPGMTVLLSNPLPDKDAAKLRAGFSVYCSSPRTTSLKEVACGFTFMVVMV